MTSCIRNHKLTSQTAAAAMRQCVRAWPLDAPPNASSVRSAESRARRRERSRVRGASGVHSLQHQQLADGAVVVRARGRQARQKPRNGASVWPSPEPPAMRCAARSRCRRRARRRPGFAAHLVVVALASNSAAPACDQAAAPCRHSPAVFLPALPGSVLRPEARQGRTLYGAVYATSQNIYDLHLQ